PRRLARRRSRGFARGGAPADRGGLDGRGDGGLPAPLPLPARTRRPERARALRGAAPPARPDRQGLRRGPGSRPGRSPVGRTVRAEPGPSRPAAPSQGEPMGTMHEVDYEILGDDMQFVKIELDPGEAAIGEAGAMMYLEEGIEVQTIFGDG